MHFDPSRSTMYHNNVLPDAACTLDHCPSLPAKEHEHKHSTHVSVS